MNKIASYLQSHIAGDVLTSDSAREFFSTDASVLTIKPSLIVYPRSTNDIRKIARFSWQLAEKGHNLPITPRGSGTDQSGAAIGRGVIMAFPAHLARILELDTKQRLVRIQPGINFKSLQETLHTHGLFLPPYPASYKYSTVGGAIANNTAGEKSLKYGAMRSWVERLEVVLANGEVIQTGRVSKKELEKKKGLATFEGDIYRAVDGIITDNAALISQYTQSLSVSKNSIGYALENVKAKDGSVDLTPLFVGSQGTLGIVTEAILKLATYSPATELIVAGFDSIESAVQATEELSSLAPSALEMVDKHLLDFVEKQQGADPLKSVFPVDSIRPAIVLFVEFDNTANKDRAKKAKKALKIIDELASQVVRAIDPEMQEKLWSIRHSAATVTNYDKAGKASVPIIEDGIVPQAKFEEYIKRSYALFEKHHLEVALWGHAGDANLHMQPLLDLKKLGDRQKVFKLMDEYYRMVISMGGSIAAEHNDGRLRAPYVALQCGSELAQVFTDLKKAFDPHGTFNPGVKTGTTLKDLAPLLRDSYNLAHLSDHLPRT
ncbi:MAG TPA: FAD-binding oxidoreductase [Candidatus Nitrosotenuis sp.]|nr:FAD-binding oxidoreductase [Candidatus Nitrosotenuis sp.]